MHRGKPRFLGVWTALQSEMIAPRLEVQNELRFYVWNNLFRKKANKS